ncbi:MAG TPA: hypothetical protein VH374_25800 [Polyangia bacterium]|jgi:hypothetical protein|nr:hypothetical protein [Polyangia bacterium]
MNGKQPSGHGAHPPASSAHQNEDQIDFTKVIVVGVVSLVAFGLCTLWAVKILDGERGRLQDEHGESRKATEVGKDEIGIVDQVPFEVDHRLEKWRQAHIDALNGYGWVDRGRGVVHIPIDKAMEQIAAGAAPPAPLLPAPTTVPAGGGR